MNIVLYKAGMNDVALIHKMQIKSFTPLLNKYQDYETNPANEPLEKIEEKLNQAFTDYYIMYNNDVPVGAIRIVKLDDKRFRVSPVFVLPEYQGKGIAQTVFKIIEQIYSEAKAWELDTILQERVNCYLYEKMGYRQTGKSETINNKLTLIEYEKRVCK